MKALYEPVCGIVRVVEGDEHGDPLVLSLTLRWVDRHTAELCGLDKSMSQEQARCILEMARGLGVKTLVQRRYRNGMLHEHCWRIA